MQPIKTMRMLLQMLDHARVELMHCTKPLTLSGFKPFSSACATFRA